jgi:hypothetical protein
MDIKNEALRLIGELPDDCTWLDVMHAMAARAGGRLVAVTDSPEELEALRRPSDPGANLDIGGWCMGPISIDLSQTPSALAEVMLRVRDAVERSLETAGLHPAPPEPDPRKMN